jgi:hypothetical protein
MKKLLFVLLIFSISVLLAQTVILGPESFEGTFPPSGWSQFSWSSSSNHWYKSTDPGHQGSYVSAIDYDPSYIQDEVLQTPPLNLSSFDACSLSFYFWQDVSYEDILSIIISLDGGGPSGTWTEIGSIYQSGSNWDEFLVDLSAYCGYSSVVIGFEYYTTTPDQNSEGVDYVTVTGHALPPPPKPWTILVLIDGDNNLEGPAIDDINEMERAVDTSLYNLIVEIDRIPGNDNSNGDWTTTRDYRITYDSNTDRIIRSQLLGDFGELNMGDPNTLITFATKYIEMYPANNYLLVLWDHGNGWYKQNNKIDPLFKGIGFDDTNNDNIGVANHEYFHALDSISSYVGGPISIVAHDACLMAMQEVSYEAKNFADVLVFSEESEPGTGYPYTDILNWLNANPNATPQQLSNAIVTKYIQSYQPGGSQYPGSVTLSALITGTQFQHLSQKIDIFAQQLINAGGLYQPYIYLARYYSQEYNYHDHIDLYDFAQRIKNETSLPILLRNSADSVMTGITSTIISEGHYTYDTVVDNSHGLAIYHPQDTTSLDRTYASLYFATYLPNWWLYLQGANEIQETSNDLQKANIPLMIETNPCHGRAIINYVLLDRTTLLLQIFDVNGRLIKTLFNGYIDRGNYSIIWNGATNQGSMVSQGIYFCQFKTPTLNKTIKFVYVQ